MTLNVDSLNLCNDNRLIGFALSVVLGLESVHPEKRRYIVFSYRFVFEFDDGTHIVPSNDQLRYYFNWKGRQRFVVNDHTFLWKYYFDSSTISKMLSHAHSFTSEICKYNVGRHWANHRPNNFKVKECAISPLYKEEKDNNDCNW